MMRVWVLQGTYEGDMFNSVHLTQKGCALACIKDMLDFLGVQDRASALTVMNDSYPYTDTDGEMIDPLEWDQDKMQKMSSDELWRIFREWNELSWDAMANRSYYIEAVSMDIQP